MSLRKRWASKEEAKKYAIKALHERKTGLSFWAACDYIGWTPKKVRDSKRPLLLLYDDWLLFMGEEYIEEEISDIKWEINTIQYVESRRTNDSIEELEEYLKVAKDALNYLKIGDWRE